MKDSFIFYRSFYEAINIFGAKTKLKLYESIMKLNFNQCEHETEVLQLCDELETDLKPNRYAYGTFMSIKPQILANFKRYKNGCKGAKYGSLGGAPIGNRNAKKTTRNENVYENENVNEDVNENANVNENEKFLKKEKSDPFLNSTKTFFAQEYEKVFGSAPYLSHDDSMRLLELSKEYKNLNEIIPDAIKKLKKIEFDSKINFTPTASWLLKGNNFERVMNGEFKSKKIDFDELREKLGID